jgi:predicted membrane protein
METVSTYDIIGIIGVAIILATYFALQTRKISSDSLLYSVANLVGSFLVIVSLLNTWNLASVIIEIFWSIISAYGIYHYYWAKRKGRKK